ncbi:MAG: YdcF family protein [Clostridia bacterium]|nr:YdcF family protein [Clostridia bacterium]
MKTFLKLVSIFFGSIIFINGVGLFFVSNFNIGNVLTVLLGTVIILTAIFLKKLNKWIKIALISCISIAVVCSSFLIIYGKTDNTTHTEDAVIVLGAAVHGKTPSLTLKRRLDTAVKYHTQNPEALIVVSGGKGAQEDISEAEAMEIYLIKKGVNPDKIIKEDRATSTYENFVFSKNILDEQLNGKYKTAFITNEYHIMRAALCANQAGFKNTTHLHSNTNISYLASGVLRECLAVIKYLVFKK